MADSPPNPSDELLSKFIFGLAQRHQIEDPELRQQYDAELLPWTTRVIQSVRRPLQTDVGVAPPRRIGVAMGLALHTAPHFSVTLSVPVRAGSVDPGEPERRADFPALMPRGITLESALQISDWELDELREEVDRRAGTALKQIRIVNWLWSYFGSGPQGDAAGRMGRILFPGIEARSADLVRRGGNLYVLVDQKHPAPEAALWLPWLAPQPAVSPTSFRARAVDPGLRTRLARGVGADDDEVAELLETMVSLVPRENAAAFLHLDQWRSSSRALMTDLGASYTAAEWLARPLPADGADWRTWLEASGATLSLKGSPEQVFDALALPRVGAMVRQLYGLILASVDRDGLGADGPFPLDLDIYDVPFHMKAVLQPLLSWPGDETTHQTVAEVLGLSADVVARTLVGVQERWQAQASTSWLGAPGGFPPSILTVVMKHIMALHASLRELMVFEPDPRWEHTDLMLLFAAHYLREARLERLWVRDLSDVQEEGVRSRLPPVEDIAGHWFWRTFLRLLDQLE